MVSSIPFGVSRLAITDRVHTADRGPFLPLASDAFTEWCREQDIELRFIQPGKPDENAYIERSNRTYRDEVLSAYLFD